jgi:hypothetical protein
MPTTFKYTVQLGLYERLIVACTHSIGQLSTQYGLQKYYYSKKQLRSTLESLKSRVNIQKSAKKGAKALKKYSTNQLLPTWRVRSGVNFNQISIV